MDSKRFLAVASVMSCLLLSSTASAQLPTPPSSGGPPARHKNTHAREDGALSTPVRENIILRGINKGVQDGLLILSRDIPESMRREVASVRQIPLSAVPAKSERIIRAGYGSVELESSVGREVEIEVKMNILGAFQLTRVLAIDPEDEED